VVSGELLAGDTTGGSGPALGFSGRPASGMWWSRAARPFAWLLVLEVAAFLGLLLVPRPLAFTAITLMIGGGILTCAHLFLPSREREPLLVFTGLALLLRLTTLVLVTYYRIAPGNPSGFLFPDSFGYDQVGQALAEHWRRGIPPRLEYQTAGYTIGYHYFVGFIYRFVGHAPMVVRVLNVLLSASLVPLTFLLGRRLADARAGMIAAALVALWPPLILWSTQLLKDTMIVFLLLVAVLAWTSFAVRPRLSTIAMAILPALPLVFVRTYMFLFWTIGLAIGLAAAALGRRKPMLAAMLAVLVLAAGIFGALEYSALRFRNVDIWLGRVNAAGKGGEGSVFEDVSYRSFKDLLLFFPLGLLRFILTPIPWKTGGVYIHEALGSVCRYALMPFAIVGFAALWRSKRLMLSPIVIALGLAAALYAAAFRGGGPRHLTQFYPYFLICAAVGLPRFRHWPLPLAMGAFGFLAVGGLLSLR